VGKLRLNLQAVIFTCDSMKCFASYPSSRRPAVRLSVRPSVTLWYCVNATQARITKSLPWTATKTVVLGSVKLFPKLERSHPDWGC